MNYLVIAECTIQKQLLSAAKRNPKAEKRTTWTFAKLMTEGRVKAALCLITNQDKGGVLPLDCQVHINDITTKSVCDILLEKHPPAEALIPSAVCKWMNPSQNPTSSSFTELGVLVLIVLYSRWMVQQDIRAMMLTVGNRCALPLIFTLLTSATPSLG